jgi:predicted aminopeptidase
MVGGVPAYSTLGRFEDPILNTMLNWSDRYLVETLFHELAHQKLYIKDDTGFNESFATAVAETGIERWLRAHGDTQDLESLARSRELLQQVRELVSTATTRLEALYASEVRMDEKRAQKARILAELRKGADDAIADSGLQVRNWLAEPLNNARLVSLGAYEGNLDAFRALLDDCAFELECFYAQAAELAQLQPVRRKQRLEALNERFVEAANADRSRSPPEKARPAQ